MSGFGYILLWFFVCAFGRLVVVCIGAAYSLATHCIGVTLMSFRGLLLWVSMARFVVNVGPSCLLNDAS